MPYTASRSGALPRIRPRWWAELPLIAVVYAAYSAGRLLARGHVSSAVDHGLAILRFERSLHINFESPLNRLFTHHTPLGVPADFAYAALHYVVTPVVLVWLWRRRPADYRALRTWLLVSTMIGLIGFTLLPTCPPRLLEASHGFVDTMAQYGSYGWWGGEASAPRGMGGLTNQYAAMPSLHVGWALWCGIALWRHGRSPWIKVAAVGYPLMITLVVMGTANHYFLDAVAGVAVMGVGALLTRPALRAAGHIGAALRVARHPTASPADSAGPKDRVGAAPRSDVTVGAAALDPAATGGGGTSVGVVGDECDTAADERIPRQHAFGSPGHGRAAADGGAAAPAR